MRVRARALRLDGLQLKLHEKKTKTPKVFHDVCFAGFEFTLAQARVL